MGDRQNFGSSLLLSALVRVILPSATLRRRPHTNRVPRTRLSYPSRWSCWVSCATGWVGFRKGILIRTNADCLQSYWNRCLRHRRTSALGITPPLVAFVRIRPIPPFLFADVLNGRRSTRRFTPSRTRPAMQAHCPLTALHSSVGSGF